MVQLLAGIISLRRVLEANPGRSYGSADTLPLRHSANLWSSAQTFGFLIHDARDIWVFSTKITLQLHIILTKRKINSCGSIEKQILSMRWIIFFWKKKSNLLVGGGAIFFFFSLNIVTYYHNVTQITRVIIMPQLMPCQTLKWGVVCRGDIAEFECCDRPGR